jgi:hypothetical protein
MRVHKHELHEQCTLGSQSSAPFLHMLGMHMWLPPFILTPQHQPCAKPSQSFFSALFDSHRWLLAASLYPRFALPDPSNRQRREQDARFHISAMGDLVVHPSSCLTGNLTALSAQVCVTDPHAATRFHWQCCL